MNFDSMQWTIVAIAVLASAGYAVQKLAPDAVRRARTRVALWFLQPDASGIERRFGRWIAPKAQAGGGCGGGTCGSCSDSRTGKLG